MQGLNPLMFVFALVANVTYVGRLQKSLYFTVFRSICAVESNVCLARSNFLRLLINLFEYCSIVVRTTEWDSIKANMPWLLDAVVCVGLDLFVSFFLLGLPNTLCEVVINNMIQGFNATP